MINLHHFAGSNESCLERVITMWLCGDSSQPPWLESLIAALQNAEINEVEVAAKLLEGIQCVAFSH